MRRRQWVHYTWLVLVATAGCSSGGPALQIVDESTRLRTDEAPPKNSPWFDGTNVSLIAARGETLGLQVLHRDRAPVTVTLGPDVAVATYAVEVAHVARPSTELYGGSHGAGDYPDGLRADPAPRTDDAYVELAIAPGAAPGPRAGELIVGARRIPIALTIAPITMPSIERVPAVWAFHKELGAAEAACAQMFRRYGVLLTPDLALADWPAHRAQLAGQPFIPAEIATGDDVRGWIAATAGTGSVPFAIPIDEPHDAAARAKVRAFADAARAAGSGPGKFLLAVTDIPRPEYGDAVDLYFAPHAAHLAGDTVMRWTYNGKPPEAGSMVVDAEAPGLRTWGWIAWRWKIPLWYAWEATYWTDRYNARRGGHAMDLAHDAVSFDDGDDHGNLDGVLAWPGCLPTLRLAALRRGQQDRALLELAARCSPDRAAAVAARLVPRALGDAVDDRTPSWPADAASWERARRELIAIASTCS